MSARRFIGAAGFDVDLAEDVICGFYRVTEDNFSPVRLSTDFFNNSDGQQFRIFSLKSSTKDRVIIYL